MELETFIHQLYDWCETDLQQPLPPEDWQAFEEQLIHGLYEKEHPLLSQLNEVLSPLAAELESHPQLQGLSTGMYQAIDLQKWVAWIKSFLFILSEKMEVILQITHAVPVLNALNSLPEGARLDDVRMELTQTYKPLSNATISRTLKTLEREGLIKYRGSTSDRRFLLSEKTKRWLQLQNEPAVKTGEQDETAAPTSPSLQMWKSSTQEATAVSPIYTIKSVSLDRQAADYF